MKATAVIDAGVCGFQTTVVATSDDDRWVAFDIDSPCEKIVGLADALGHLGPIDAYQEISPAGTSAVLETVRGVLKGCCAGCAVPVGVFKCMQVAAGLALPKEVRICLSKE